MEIVWEKFKTNGILIFLPFWQGKENSGENNLAPLLFLLFIQIFSKLIHFRSFSFYSLYNSLSSLPVALSILSLYNSLTHLLSLNVTIHLFLSLSNTLSPLSLIVMTDSCSLKIIEFFSCKLLNQKKNLHFFSVYVFFLMVFPTLFFSPTFS